VVLDVEIGPLLDVALRAVGHADEHDVAQVEIAPGFSAEKIRDSATAFQKSGR
jgi:hypothetical protein